MKPQKTWTGERLETHIFSENTAEHLHRYAIAKELSVGKTVLDIACGEGYGSSLLADKAAYVFGVDISTNTIKDAQQKYKKNNLKFEQGSATAIPIKDSTIDIVVSFETIEHHPDHQEMLLEIKRVLKEDGILIMSSPDKLFYSDLSGYRNPFHVKELYSNEFENLINSHFLNTKYYKQKFVSGSILELEGLETKMNYFTGNYNEINKIDLNPLYNIVIASDAQIGTQDSSFFFSGDLIKVAQRQIEEKYLNSTTWKVGSIILKPLVFLNNLLKGGK